MALNIADLFEHAVDAVPDKPAVQVGDRVITFAELEAEVHRLQRGIDERDRAIRDAAARVADVVEPCVVCRRVARVGTALVCRTALDGHDCTTHHSTKESA